MGNKIFGAELKLDIAKFSAPMKAAGNLVDGLLSKVEAIEKKGLALNITKFTRSIGAAESAVATLATGLGHLNTGLRSTETAGAGAAAAVGLLTSEVRHLDAPLKGLSAVGNIVKGFGNIATAAASMDKTLPSIVTHMGALPAALAIPVADLGHLGTAMGKAKAAAQGLNTSLNGITAKLNQIAKAAEKSALTLGVLAQVAPAITQGAGAIGQALAPLQGILTGVGQAAKGAQQNMGQASTTASKFAAAVGKIVGHANGAGISVNQAAVAVGKMNAQASKSGGPMATLAKGLSTAYKAAKSFIGGIGNVGQTIERVGLSLRNVGGGLTAMSYGLERVAVKALGVNSQFDGARIAFEHFTGSAAGADKIISKLKEMASTSPFDFSELQGWVQRMTAVGVSFEESFNWLSKIGDAASYLGGDPKQKMESVINALIQMKAQGTVLKEELNQVAQTGINSFQIMHDKLGVATEDIGRIGELGISSAKAIDAILTSLGEQYKGGMEAYSSTLAGTWSMLVDNVTFAADVIGASLTKAFDLKNVVQGLTETIGQITAWFVKLTPETQKSAFAMLAFLAALGPVMLIGGQVLALVGSLVTMFAALASPAGLAALALAGIAYEMVKLALTDEETRKGIMEGWPALKNALVGVWDAVRDAWPVVQAAIEGDWKIFETKYAEFSKKLGEGLSKAFEAAWAIAEPIIIKAVENVMLIIEKVIMGKLGILGDAISMTLRGWALIIGEVGALIDAFNKKNSAIRMKEWEANNGQPSDPTGPIVGEAMGGKILGPGTGTSDSIPAWLSNGEFVMNAASTKKYEPLLQKMNKNKYASGGSVGGSMGFIPGSDDYFDAFAEVTMQLKLARDEARISAQMLEAVQKQQADKLAEISTRVGGVTQHLTGMLQKAGETSASAASTAASVSATSQASMALKEAAARAQGIFVEMNGHLMVIDRAAMTQKMQETNAGDVGAVSREAEILKEAMEVFKANGDAAGEALLNLKTATDALASGKYEELSWTEIVNQSTELAALQIQKLGQNTEEAALKGDAFGEALLAGKGAIQENMTALQASTAAQQAETQQSLLSIAQEKIRNSEFSISTEKLIAQQSDLIDGLSGTYTVATDSINASFEHIKNAGDMFQKYTTETWKMQQGATFLNMQAIKDSQAAFLRLMIAMDAMAARNAARDAATAASWANGTTTAYGPGPVTHATGSGGTDTSSSGNWWENPLSNSPWSNYDPMAPINAGTGQAGYGNWWENPLSNSPWSPKDDWSGMGHFNGTGGGATIQPPPVNVTLLLDGQVLLKSMQVQASKYGSANIYAW